jgi:uncharacterized membrane protein
MRKSFHLVLSLAFALLLCAASEVSAQTSGEITGLVTDSSGAAVSGATATVTNKATGATRRVTTNSEGLYAFPGLLPGVYELKVEQGGFKTAAGRDDGNRRGRRDRDDRQHRRPAECRKHHRRHGD